MLAHSMNGSEPSPDAYIYIDEQMLGVAKDMVKNWPDYFENPEVLPVLPRNIN